MVLLLVSGGTIKALVPSGKQDNNIIKVYAENPMYWQYKGLPVLLLGGTVDDNLFQIESLKEHLDLLQSVGGNYVRCTMSSRNAGNVKPFAKEGGLFNLDEPNPEYWNRFEKLLSLASERDIIVQIEFYPLQTVFDRMHNIFPKLRISFHFMCIIGSHSIAQVGPLK